VADSEGKKMLVETLTNIADGVGKSADSPPTSTERMRAALALACLDEGVSGDERAMLRRIINGNSN
jgi:tellurite resistance protein